MYICIHVNTHIYLQFIYSFINGCLDHFYLLLIVNNALMNKGAQIPASNSALKCFEYLFRSGILDLMVTVCFILEEWSCCFPQQLYTLHSHQQGTRIPIPPQSCQPLLFPGVCLFLKYGALLYVVINPSSNLHQIRKKCSCSSFLQG